MSTSGGKGYHVELFFDRPVRTSLLRLLYEKVIGGGNLNPHQVEFRPTAGSAIKLPLSIHAKTGNVCWYVDRRTLEPIEDDRYILTIKQMKASWIEEALADMEPEACADSEAETACPDSTVLIAPGTRHIQMRNIAVYMRQHGADEPSIRRELTTWYEKQPPDTIRSARDVVMEDIEELVAWVFSENFCMSYQPDPRKVKLSAADMRRVLRVGSRSVRRIYFLIMVRCYAGQAEISLEEIAEATGISRKTVTQALRKMREMHCVECRPGIRKKLSDGRFVCEKNRYRIPPAPAEAVQYAVPVDAVSMMSSFEDCYHQALHTLLSRSEAYELLTEEEAADYDAYAAKHRKQEIEKLPFLDLQGTPVSYSHDGYGEITAFASEGQVWFPARACARI